jgi:hypothetical protein
MDRLAEFKEIQKQGWVHFAPFETITPRNWPNMPGFVPE